MGMGMEDEVFFFLLLLLTNLPSLTRSQQSVNCDRRKQVPSSISCSVESGDGNREKRVIRLLLLQATGGVLNYLFSFTSPRDVCRLSLVCKSFLAAAQIDLLWDSFLPPDVDEILSRATEPVDYSSSKELYFGLCQPLLVDRGKLSFQLERLTGKKLYMLSRKTMCNSKRSGHLYYKSIFLPHSRFIRKQSEVHSTSRFEIVCSMDSRLLSQKTMYTAYMIYKLNYAYGFDSNCQKASIKLGAHSQEHRVSLVPVDDEEEEERQIHLREDPWLEMEIGEIYNDQGDEGEIEMRFLDNEELHWKGGLVFAGFEIRRSKRKVDVELLR